MAIIFRSIEIRLVIIQCDRIPVFSNFSVAIRVSVYLLSEHDPSVSLAIQLISSASVCCDATIDSGIVRVS